MFILFRYFFIVQKICNAGVFGIFKVKNVFYYGNFAFYKGFRRPVFNCLVRGNKEYGKFLGLTTALNSLGLAVGDPVMNFIHDKLGSYTLAIWIAVGAIAVSTVAFQIVLTAAHKDREKILAQNSLQEVQE